MSLQVCTSCWKGRLGGLKYFIILILILSLLGTAFASETDNKPNAAKRFADYLKDEWHIPAWLIVALIGSTPIFELRGAIPVGIGLRMEWWNVLIWALIGNLIPIIPLLLWLEPVSSFLGKHPWGNKFFKWLFARTRRKGKMIEKYAFWGLALFVGIPLPGTGAWTGCVAAFVFGVSFKKALAAVITGVFMAAIIVTLTVTGLFSLGSIFL
ncbi:MAG: small multi-drug export protein [Candidatus Coatesbacteria bacterium]|nr:small multi-drug export protein [Candidatus Coatesbacteria bacterium]